jgi:hypothetical protein
LSLLGGLDDLAMVLLSDVGGGEVVRLTVPRF